MRRNSVAGSAVIVSLVLLFSYGVVGTEAIARATRGVINLPRMVRRSAGDFQWRGNVRPGGTIEVKGVNGDVTAVPASGPDVEVTAERKARRNNPEDVRLEVVEHAVREHMGGLTSRTTTSACGSWYTFPQACGSSGVRSMAT